MRQALKGSSETLPLACCRQKPDMLPPFGAILAKISVSDWARRIVTTRSRRTIELTGISSPLRSITAESSPPCDRTLSVKGACASAGVNSARHAPTSRSWAWSPPPAVSLAPPAQATSDSAQISRGNATSRNRRVPAPHRTRPEMSPTTTVCRSLVAGRGESVMGLVTPLGVQMLGVEYCPVLKNELEYA